MATYTIQHVQGYGPHDHFGREIAARVAGTYPTLASARRALREAKKAHGGSQPGRFDVVRSDGRRTEWA